MNIEDFGDLPDKVFLADEAAEPVFPALGSAFEGVQSGLPYL
jgi:hypothetical protein